jgi:hypothetical protein
MDVSTTVIVKWADGRYAFHLGLDQIEELQRLCKAGFGEISTRLFSGQYYIQDIYETIRLALIGGGMAPTIALDKMDAYVYRKPVNRAGDPSSPHVLAMAIFAAVINGIEEAPPGEQQAGTEEASSMSPQSEPQPSSQELAPSKSES